MLKPLPEIITDLERSDHLPSCQKCGCMRETLETVSQRLAARKEEHELTGRVRDLIRQLHDPEYT